MPATAEPVKMGHQVVWFKRYIRCCVVRIICSQYIYFFRSDYFIVVTLFQNKVALSKFHDNDIVVILDIWAISTPPLLSQYVDESENEKLKSNFLTNMYKICKDISIENYSVHDDVIKWKHFPRYWPFVWWIHRSPVNFPHRGQWRGASMYSLICVWINGWINNRDAGDLRRYRAHYDVIVMRSQR